MAHYRLGRATCATIGTRRGEHVGRAARAVSHRSTVLEGDWLGSLAGVDGVNGSQANGCLVAIENKCMVSSSSGDATRAGEDANVKLGGSRHNQDVREQSKVVSVVK